MSHSEDHDADSLICTHAFHRERPVNLVYRESDGFWTFTCGKSDHERKEDVLPVCHGCALVENDLEEKLGDLQAGQQAYRERPEEPWVVEQLLSSGADE